MSNDGQDFEAFIRQRAEAALAYTNGNAAPLGELAAKNLPATFFSPRGDIVQGTDAVWSRYEQDAKSFGSGNTTDLDILHMAASGDIAYWVGIQRATVSMQGQAEPVVFNLRITEIFRREAGEWKMIHRHADQMAANEDK